jgi:hypothetical protein
MHQGGRVVDQQGAVIRLEVECGFVIALGQREVAMIGFVLAGKEVGGGGTFGIGGLCEAGQGVGINLAVADDLFGDVGFVVEGGRGRSDVGSGSSGGGVNGGGGAGVDVVDGGFWDGVGVFAEVILDAVFICILADLVGRDGASILKMNDVGGRGKGRQKH